MARHAQELSVGADNTRHISMGALALCYPVREVQLIIEQCGRASRRLRDLPALVVVFYVISLSLFPGVGYEGVLRWLLSGLQWLGAGRLRVSTKGALSTARQQLGAEPLRLMHQRMALPMAQPDLAGCYWRGLHVVAMDGSTLALQDTASNAAAFGRPGNQHGAAAYPVARFVALAEAGTHLVFAAQMGGYRDSEITLAGRLVPRLQPGMLCLADRLFSGYELWKQAAATGAHLLWRAKNSLPLIRIKDLADGSWLARWPASPRNQSSRGQHQVVRVVEYRLQPGPSQGGPPPEGSGELYRLITTLLDPAVADAVQLAQLYPQRWEMELTFKEGKSVLRHGRLTLRSKVAALVEQEFWGLLLAHYLVRKMMAQAAGGQGLDPDRLSYQAGVEIIKAVQTGPVLSFPP
jgi:transposase IS4-like protein/DDE family transposase